MSDGTGISWTDATWPVVTGCDHVSEGCDNCYAAKLTSGRLKHLPAYAGLAENGRFNGQVRLLPDRLDWPRRWRKPRKVFVSDMADLFHDQVPEEYIARVWAVMAASPQHTFQVLTKRHARVRALLRPGSAFRDRVRRQLAVISEDWPVSQWEPDWRWDNFTCPRPEWPLPNVWVGVSAEDQHWAGIRVPALLDAEAAIRFVSAEPLLGAVDLSAWLGPVWKCLDWVIAGGESGPRHRPMSIAWLDSIVSQCKYEHVPVWVKQDSGPRAGQQGRIPDDLFVQEFPVSSLTGAA